MVLPKMRKLYRFHISDLVQNLYEKQTPNCIRMVSIGREKFDKSKASHLIGKTSHLMTRQVAMKYCSMCFNDTHICEMKKLNLRAMLQKFFWKKSRFPLNYISKIDIINALIYTFKI